MSELQHHYDQQYKQHQQEDVDVDMEPEIDPLQSQMILADNHYDQQYKQNGIIEPTALEWNKVKALKEIHHELSLCELKTRAEHNYYTSPYPNVLNNILTPSSVNNSLVEYGNNSLLPTNSDILQIANNNTQHCNNQVVNDESKFTQVVDGMAVLLDQLSITEFKNRAIQVVWNQINSSQKVTTTDESILDDLKNVWHRRNKDGLAFTTPRLKRKKIEVVSENRVDENSMDAESTPEGGGMAPDSKDFTVDNDTLMQIQSTEEEVEEVTPIPAPPPSSIANATPSQQLQNELPHKDEDTNQELTQGQKNYDKRRMVNGISTRNRLCEALRGVDASSVIQDARLTKMPSDEQAKAARIGDVLSSMNTNSSKTGDLVHRLLKAYGLDDDSITEIINRTPDGVLHELKTYIRASPSNNSAKLAASVLSQHLSHQMSATYYKELHTVDLTQSAPHIVIGHSRHSGETSKALANLIYDLIKAIVETPDINLYVMATEALRFDESLEVICQIIDVFKKLKVKELVLDSMELDTVRFAAIGCKHRHKKREIGAIASHKNAGKSIISADLSTQLKIYKAAVPIQDDINAECTDNVTFTTIDKAKKDGDAFVKKYRNAIEECNKELQRLLKKVEAGDITAKEAIRQYLELPVLKTIPVDQIPKLLDYGRTSRGTLKDPNYQLSLNVAVGRVLYDDDESVERMIIQDIHKNRDKLGHEGFATFCMCIGTGHVDRSTLTDPVRIGDNKCQIDMYEELCIQTDTLALFSRCYGKDIKAVAEMEVWRDREMASALDECKEEKEGMIVRELKDRKNHDSFDMLKGTNLSMLPPELEEKKNMIIKMLEKQAEKLENEFKHEHQASAARRLLPQCKVLSFGIVEGRIGITFEKPLGSYVCTVKEVHVESSPFQVGDVIVSLKDTLIFDKSGSQITQLFGSSIERSVIIIRPPKLVQNQLKMDESLQCIIQVKALFSEVDQQSPPSIQQFVEKAEAIFSSGLGSPDGKVRSNSGYTTVQNRASSVRSQRWTTFLKTVDEPLTSVIEKAKWNFYHQRRYGVEPDQTISLMAKPEGRLGLTLTKTVPIKITNIDQDSVFVRTLLKELSTIKSINGETYVTYDQGITLLEKLKTDEPVVIVVRPPSAAELAELEKERTRMAEEKRAKAKQELEKTLVGMQFAVATHSFQPNESESVQLSFQTGDVIMLNVSLTGNGWVMGCKLGEGEKVSGWCPLTHLKKFDDQSSARSYAETLMHLQPVKEKASLAYHKCVELGSDINLLGRAELEALVKYVCKIENNGGHSKHCVNMKTMKERLEKCTPSWTKYFI